MEATQSAQQSSNFANDSFIPNAADCIINRLITSWINKVTTKAHKNYISQRKYIVLHETSLTILMQTILSSHEIFEFCIE